MTPPRASVRIQSPTRAERLAALLRGLTALLALAAMLIGFPAVLLVVGPRPDTARLPSWPGVVAALTRPDDGTLLVGALAAVAWLGWAAFTVSVLVELLAVVRRLPTPHLPLLGWPQAVAASMVAAIVVMLLPVSRATAAPTRPDVVTTHLDRTPTRPPTSPPVDDAPAEHRHANAAPPADAATTVTVREGDTLWSLAAEHLGHGRRFQEIADLNYGRRQPDGATLTDTHWIHPGWQLLIPTTAPAAPGTDDDGAEYVVQPDDTLYGIAASHLGDGDRYPEIATLNHDRSQPGGTHLTDPDLIRPGWTLHLPPTHPNQQPPPDAAPATPPPSAAPPPSTTPQPTAASSEADGSSPTEAPPADPVPAATTSTTETHDVQATGNAPAEDEPERPIQSHQEGITLPGGFVPWSLAAAISSAVAMVWLQRRRRYLPHNPDDGDDDLAGLPEPILGIDRHVRAHLDHAPATDPVTRVHDVAPQTQTPPGGICITGPGAQAAARAALVTALAAGSPSDPDRRGEVVIDGSTLSNLIGADAAALGPWPRLHIADSFDHALSLIEAQLLHRARILDEHALTDLASLRRDAPSEEALPPILLIGETPPPEARMRARTALALGADVDVTAILLGDWELAASLRIDPDGHAEASSDNSAATDLPSRLAVLDIDATVAALTTLREAQTGDRPAVSTAASVRPPASKPPAEAMEASTAAVLVTDPAEPDMVQGKAKLCVLGTPHIEDITADGRPLRAKAAELAVYLACHRHGADIRTIGEHLSPDMRLRQADQNVHTNVSNLRHVLGRAAGFRKIGYVTKDNGRYRLDPGTVDVDLWRLRDLLARASAAAPDDRLAMLGEACDLGRLPLADGCDYDWIEPHRERARRQAMEAHLLLADLLLDADPHQAVTVLDAAIAIDRYNEEAYRKAMTARHRCGDVEGARLLYRILKQALAEIDTEPDEKTNEQVPPLA